MTGSRSSWTSAGIRSLGTGSTDQEPAGRSVSASSSPRISPDSGVAGAGLRMIGAPTAMAGATLWAHRFSGKLNGAMPRTGPRGKRRVSASRPAPPASVSSRCASPPLKRRASSAAKRKTETARPTSPRAHLMGLPFSAEISRAISSVRSASRRCDVVQRGGPHVRGGRGELVLDGVRGGDGLLDLGVGGHADRADEAAVPGGGDVEGVLAGGLAAGEPEGGGGWISGDRHSGTRPFEVVGDAHALRERLLRFWRLHPR